MAGCTAVISSGKTLAMLYFKRGNAYDNKGDHDRAIAGFDEAIRLDPKYELKLLGEIL
jgi:tetratricopeptide (TPR) repeat protein